MDKADLVFLSAGELGRLIEKKQVSPVEAIEAYLDRIDDLDFKFNSYLAVSRDEALQAACDAETAIVQGNYLGPMHGIPVAIKDQLWTKGIRSTGGSRFMADFIPEEDATVVANLKKAGAIVLGKTNLTELALTGFTHRFSTTRNPWNLNASAGGSSSGSGAATAAFLCATSLGEDTGGSIRFPATWCGVVGIRPSWGRVSRYGLMRGVWSQDTVGPISRTVEDAAITLGAIAGYDPKDNYMWNTPVPDYRKALDGNIKGTRVGVFTQEFAEILQPDVGEVVTKAISVLEELGAVVEDVSIPLARHAGMISTVGLRVEPASNKRDWVRQRLEDFGHDNRVGMLTGSIIPGQTYLKAQKLKVLLRRQVFESLERFDLLVSPTAAIPAQPIVGDPVVTSKEAAMRLSFLLGGVFHLSCAPAISVPCGFSSDGLPIGLQIGGGPGSEETIFKMAHAYEQTTPWHTMRPPNA